MMRFGRTIDDAFTHNEIKERFENLEAKNPNLSVDEVIRLTKDELSQDAEHFQNHGLNR